MTITASAQKAQITVWWSSVPGATLYKLYKYVGGSDTLVYSGTAGGTYVDTSVYNNTNYSYTILVYGTDENGTPFAQGAGTSCKTPLPAPEVLALVGKAAVLLGWDQHENADYYRVWWAPNQSTGWNEVNGQFTNSFLHTGRMNQTWYYYKVQGINNAGAGYYNDTIAAFVFLEAPKNVKCSRDGSNSIIVNWDPAPNADSYRIYMSSTSGLGFSLVGETTSCTFDAGAYTAKRFFYVAGYNEGGKGYPSKEANTDNVPTSKAKPPHEGACPRDPATGCVMNPPTGALPIACGSGVGPSDGDPVNVATGGEAYMAPVDISVYNPYGPQVVFQRHFRTDVAKSGYGSPGLPNGWIHNYDVAMVPTSNTMAWDYVTLSYPNGAVENLYPVLNGGLPTGAFSRPAGAPYIVQGVPSSVMNQWDSITITWKDRTQWRFVPHSSGCLALDTITDRMGHSIRCNLDSERRLMSIEDVSSNTTLLSFTYGMFGCIKKVQDVYNRKVVYTMGTASNLKLAALTKVSQIVDASASTAPDRATYGYAGLGYPDYNRLHLVSITVTSATGTGESQASLSYDSNLRVSSRTDGNSNTREYTYGSGTTRIDVKNPQGTTILYWNSNYNTALRATGTTDSANYSDLVDYGDGNNPAKPTQWTDRNGKQTSATYDTYGNVLTTTDARGVVTTNTYDYNVFELGRLISSQTAGKPATTITYYEPSGLVESITSPRPGGGGTVTTTYTYDSLGNVLTVTSPGNNAVTTMTTTYNFTTDGSYSQAAKMGQPITVTDNAGHVSHLRYDAQGRVTSAMDALGNTTDSTYNVVGQTLTVTLPPTGQSGSGRAYVCNTYLYPGGPVTSQITFNESGTQIRSTAYTYGNEGEVLTVSGSTEPATYTYDSAYRTKTLTDGSGNVTTYNYNARGLLSSVVYPGSDTEQFTSYDNDGNLLSGITPNGIVFNCLYDDLENLLTGVQYPSDPTRNRAFNYDGFGRLSAATDAVGVTSYTYGDIDELLSTTTTYTGLPSQTLSYGYYADGSRSTLTTPSGTFTYSYDNAGRIVGLSNPFSEVTTWSYLDNGWLAQQTHENGTYSSYGYNQAGRLVSLLNSKSDNTTLSEFSSLVYDGMGNLTSVQTTVTGVPLLSGTTSYIYDSKNQLTQENSARNGGYTHNYAYSPTGNATTFKGATWTFNAKNQHSDTGYGYDYDGNPTTYRGNSLTFDFEGNLRAFGALMTADYDGSGRRAWKENANGRFYYLYDGSDIVCELDTLGNVLATNTWGVNGLVSRNTSAGSVFYSYDFRGSTIQRLDASENVVSSHGQDATGLQYSGSFDLDPYSGFGAQFGYRTDPETGLQLLGFRYYDPLTGRFVTRDPIGYAGGLNLYAYCRNNPVTRVDEDGLEESPLWYDSIGNFFDSLKESTELYVPWYVAGAVNTGVDIISGPLRMPQTIGHYGEGFGAYAGNPHNPDNQIGGWNDIGTTCSLGLFFLGSTVPRAALPIEGIYVVKTARGTKYVGQSGSMASRLARHVSDKKFTKIETNLAKGHEVLGGKLAREIAEQRMIDALRKKGVKLDNKRNPIGKKRRKFMK